MTKKKQSTSKKIALSTMTATMAVSGLLPLAPGTEAHASVVNPVTEPSNVMATKNDGEKMKVDWEKNGSPDGTQYYLMANAKDAAIKTESLPTPLVLDGWKLNPKPYFETTASSWYETDKTAGTDTISFETTVPEHALDATLSFRYSSRTNDVMTIKIDGKAVNSVSGYKGEILNYPLTAGKHTIEFSFNNKLNTDYAGTMFLKDIAVNYRYKDTVASGWVDGNSYTFEGLDKSKDYDVRVVAKNGDTRSTIKTAQTATLVQNEAVPSGNKLSWTPTTTGAVSYEVLRDGETIYEGSDRTFTDTEVVGRKGYFYLVNSIDVNGDVIESMYKRVTTPEYANITATPTLEGAELDWTFSKQETDVEKYQVYRGDELIYEGTEKKFLDRGALGGKDYAYTLKVVGEAPQTIVGGEGDNTLETDTLSVKMPVNPPKSVIVTRDEPTVKDVIWNHNHNNPDTEYKAIAKPAGAVKKEVKFEQNLNGSSFPASMNFKLSNNWRTVVPYWWTVNTTDLWYEPTDYAGANTMSFDAEIPLTATNAKFSMAYSSVSNDVMEIKVDGVRKWSVVGYVRTGNPKHIATVDLTPGKKHKIEVIFNNTNNNGDYGGTSFVDDLKISYMSDGSIESDWTKDSKHTFNGLDASKEYNVTVQARNQAESTPPVAGQTAVQLGLKQEAGSVETDFDYLLEGAETYELLRNGESIYEGNEDTFVDEETNGLTTYNYTLLAKDADGNTLGSTKKSITTPNYVSATVESENGDVAIDMDYAKDRDVTYSIARNGEVVYEGSNETFIDNTAVGATDYSYVVTAKEGDNVVGTVTKSLKTPLASLTKLKVEQTSATSATTSWKDEKNPENTEYKVTATPVGESENTIVEVKEDFEDGESAFKATGNWTRTNAQRKDGTQSLRSAVIGHNGTTAQTYEVTVPADAKSSTLNFDYMISSEQNFDFFRLYLNGTEVVKDSGSKSWTNVTKALKTGVNVVKFEYKKDSSSSVGQDAVFVDNLKVATEGNSNPTSGWVKGETAEINGLKEGVEYEYRIVAKANGLESAPVLMNNNVLEEVTEGVEALEADMETADLTSRENIEEAQALLDELKALVDELEDGEEKQALLDKATELQNILDEAEKVVDATDAVEAIVVPEAIESAESLEAIKEAVKDAQDKIDSVKEGEQKTTLQAELDSLKEELVKAEDIFVAKEDVKEGTSLVEAADSREEVAEAKESLKTAKETVAKVTDESLKAELLSQIEELESKLVAVEKVLDATEAVSAVEVLVQDIDSFEALNGAKEAVKVADEKIAILPEGEVKAELSTSVEGVKAEIEVIEYALVTDKALDEVEGAGIDTPEALNTVKEQVKAIEERIANVADEATKAEFADRLEVVKESVEVKEAGFAVDTLVKEPTVQTLEEAKKQVQDVTDAQTKKDMTETVDKMEKVLSLKERLKVIMATDFKTLQELDAVVLEMKDIKGKIDAIGSTDVEFGQKAVLGTEYKKAKFHVGKELTGVLNDTKKDRYKGSNKTGLQSETMTFLVEYTVDKNIVVYVKDKVDFIFDYLPSFVEYFVNNKIRGIVQGELQPIIGKNVTGKQLSDMIDDYMSKR